MPQCVVGFHLLFGVFWQVQAIRIHGRNLSFDDVVGQSQRFEVRPHEQSGQDTLPFALVIAVESAPFILIHAFSGNVIVDAAAVGHQIQSPQFGEILRCKHFRQCMEAISTQIQHLQLLQVLELFGQRDQTERKQLQVFQAGQLRDSSPRIKIMAVWIEVRIQA